MVYKERIPAKQMRFTTADLLAYQAREAARKHSAKPTEGVEREADLPIKSFAVRLTTDEEKLNKTERAFLAHLRANPGEVGAWIGIQSVTLKLGDDCRYTPDFFCVGSSGAVAWEVKGFMRDDALVKLKTAARAFSWIKFILVKRDKDTPEGWIWKPINP